MTNDPPDTSRQCPTCLNGALLPDRSECPNPICPKNPGPLFSLQHVPRVARWLGPVESVFPDFASVTRYRAARFEDSAGQQGWAWRRE